MKQSDVMRKEEEKKDSFLERQAKCYMGNPLDDRITPVDGMYQIQPIVMMNDYVAIAPLPQKEVTEGGIIVPGAVQEQQSIGVVVGAGPKVADTCGTKIPIGLLVKFFPRNPVADLTGCYGFYGQAAITVVRPASVISAVGGVKVNIVPSNPVYEGIQGK